MHRRIQNIFIIWTFLRELHKLTDIRQFIFHAKMWCDETTNACAVDQTRCVVYPLPILFFFFFTHFHVRYHNTSKHSGGQHTVICLPPKCAIATFHHIALTCWGRLIIIFFLLVSFLVFISTFYTFIPLALKWEIFVNTKLQLNSLVEMQEWETIIIIMSQPAIVSVLINK